MFFQVALLLAALVVGIVNRPKTQAARPASFDEFDFPQGTEGTPQIEVFGTCWVDNWMVLGAGNFRTSPIRK